MNITIKGIKQHIIKDNFQSYIKPMTNAVIIAPDVLITAPKIDKIQELNCVVSIDNLVNNPPGEFVFISKYPT